MYRVVVVDDEWIVLKGIEVLLSRIGIDAEIAGTAQDGKTALQVIREKRPDVVITDIRIPYIDGLSLIEASRDFLPDADYIIISGYQDFEYARRALRLGALDYIDKPVTEDKLRAAFRRIEAERSLPASQKSQVEGTGGQQAAEPAEQPGAEHSSSLYSSTEQSRALQPGALQAGELQSTAMQSSGLQSSGLQSSGLQETVSDSASVSVDGHAAADSHITGDNGASGDSHSAVVSPSIGDSRVSGDSHAAITKVLTYIRDNYHKDIGLTELSELVGMNPAYLSALFKETVGISFIKYLTGLRIDEARRLLSEGHKASEVGRMIGYNDPHYFYEIFKKSTGLTPSEWKNHGGKSE